MRACCRTFRFCHPLLMIAAVALLSGGAQAASEAAGIRFAQAVLHAESVDAADVERYSNRLCVLASELDAVGTIVGDNLQKVAAIHHFMHARVLKGGYSADA